MGKSRGRGRSEVETLRGQIRQLQKELKYYRQRAHIEHSIIDEEPVEITDATKCPNCHNGVLVEYDWRFVVVKKCSSCDHQIRKRK